MRVRETRNKIIALWFFVGILGIVPLPAESAIELVRDGNRSLERGIAGIDDDFILDAADSFQRALELNPRYGDAVYGLARSYYWLGEISEADGVANRAASLLPGRTDVMLLQARIDSALGNDEDARMRFAEVLALEPYNVDAMIGPVLLDLGSGRTESVYARLQNLQNRYPENRRLLLSMALLAAELGEYEAAGLAIEPALRLFPSMPEVHLLAAELAFADDDIERADYHARNAVALQGKLVQGWEILVTCAIALGDDQLALVRSNELIALDPQNAYAWFSRGVILGAGGTVQPAIQSLERCISLQPDFDLARIALENILLAETDLENPLRAPYAARYGVTARAYEERFLNRRAEALLRRGLRLDPFNTELRYAMAELYLQQGYRARYVRELQVIDDLAPGNREIEDRIEAYQAVLRDSPSNRWQVDQFVVSRPKLQVGVYYRESGYLDRLPMESYHIGEYIRTLLAIEEHIETGATDAYSIRSEALRKSRDNGDDYALLISSTGDERSVVLQYEFVLVRNGRSIILDRIIRSGNERVSEAAGSLTRNVADAVPRAAAIIGRNFETLLVSMGTRDGLAEGTVLPVIHTGAYRVAPDGRTWEFSPENRVADVTVDYLDDLCFEGSIQTPSPGLRLSIGDAVLISAPVETQPDEESALSETPAPSSGLLQRLLMIR